MHPTPELIAAITEWFRAVADENRVRILMQLKNGESNVTGLVDELGISQASVSKHLAVLRQAHIVEVRREGTQAFYRIRSEAALKICALVCGDVRSEKQRVAAALGSAEWEI